MSKVLFVIAKEGFRDVEFLTPARVVKEAGRDVYVASNAAAGETARGADGAEVKVDYDLSEVAADDFNMIVFVGGPGALQNLDNEKSYKLARETVVLQKPLAAICVAPVILAKAGVLRGVKATVWSSVRDKSSIEILRNAGADYAEQAVVVDGSIITANGPGAAEEFGKTLIKLL